MLNTIRDLLVDYKRFRPKKQARSKNSPPVESEAICQGGLIGLGAIWDVYDMWI